MTGINVKIWNLENTIKNLTDQVKILQKQNDAMKTDVKVASKTGKRFLCQNCSLKILRIYEKFNWKTLKRFISSPNYGSFRIDVKLFTTLK